MKWQYPIRDIKEEEKYPACWYNIHYNEDFESIGINRVVIHTRQLSRIFNPRLLNEIAREIHLNDYPQLFLKNLAGKSYK